MKCFFLILCILFFYVNSYCQSSPRILFIIDSVPVLDDPDPLDKLLLEDIADSSTLINKDSIQLTGWKKMDVIVYFFTKEYRRRSDSINQIPNQKQMQFTDGVWMYRNTPYTGRYRKYYLNGKLQAEGSMYEGNVNDDLVSYYKNGAVKSTSYFVKGKKHGSETNYYRNGKVLRKTVYDDNVQISTTSFFINGQLQDEFKTSPFSRTDTLIQYYSTGKIKKMKVVYKNGFATDRKAQQLKDYINSFYGHLYLNKIPEANNDLFFIRKLDDNSPETLFMEGLLMAHEFRFSRAIEMFDKALTIELLMGDALAQRAMCRIKLYKYKGAPIQAIIETPLSLDDLRKMPKNEQAKVCSDLMMADSLDTNIQFVFNYVPGEMLPYCAGEK